MKKILTAVFILFASILCSACINNLAIQELNQIGKEYLDKGDIDNAISRFQSVVDLDENVFETQYNLSIAYIQKEKYSDALVHLDKAIRLKPEFADTYYSYAVALEGVAIPEITDVDNLDEFEESQIQNPDLDMLAKAIENYERYLKLKPNAEDSSLILAHISDLKNKFLNTDSEGNE